MYVVHVNSMPYCTPYEQSSDGRMILYRPPFLNRSSIAAGRPLVVEKESVEVFAVSACHGQDESRFNGDNLPEGGQTCQQGQVLG